MDPIGADAALSAPAGDVVCPELASQHDAGLTMRNLYLSTLAQYVAALGGTLRISAVFDDEEVEIGVGSNDAAPSLAIEDLRDPEGCRKPDLRATTKRLRSTLMSPHAAGTR